jgi:hypothetical protein
MEHFPFPGEEGMQPRPGNAEGAGIGLERWIEAVAEMGEAALDQLARDLIEPAA